MDGYLVKSQCLGIPLISGFWGFLCNVSFLYCIKKVKKIPDLPQGLKIEVGHRQLTVDFVNDVALQLAGSDHDDRLHGDKIDYAERLGQMNKRYQMLATDVIDRQKKLEALELQWEEYERGLNNMYSWFEDMGARVEKYSRLGHEMSVRTALKDSQVCGVFSLLNGLDPWGRGC